MFAERHTRRQNSTYRGTLELSVLVYVILTWHRLDSIKCDGISVAVRLCNVTTYCTVSFRACKWVMIHGETPCDWS